MAHGFDSQFSEKDFTGLILVFNGSGTTHHGDHKKRIEDFFICKKKKMYQNNCYWCHDLFYLLFILCNYALIFMFQMVCCLLPGVHVLPAPTGRLWSLLRHVPNEFPFLT
jgi:hypothetical protein